jgi:hypothetical protein
VKSIEEEDLLALNKFCLRETMSAALPLDLEPDDAKGESIGKLLRRASEGRAGQHRRLPIGMGEQDGAYSEGERDKEVSSEWLGAFTPPVPRNLPIKTLQHLLKYALPSLLCSSLYSLFHPPA